MGKEGSKQSLTRLCQYDDFLTDILVDSVFYWAKVRKMKVNYLPNRRVKSDQVIKVIKEHVIGGKNVSKGLEELQRLDGVKAFTSRLSNDQERADFTKHARRYLSMYLPNTGIEMGTTCRYSFEPEARITARKSYQRGEEIKNLCGVLVKMTEADEEEYRGRERDFSVMHSSRMNGNCLLLGPARFVNHDCEPNARFVTTSKDLITLTATRDIELGEEITASYSDHYFGEDNCECLCRTCEDKVRGGFAMKQVKKEEVDGDAMDISQTPAPEVKPEVDENTPVMDEVHLVKKATTSLPAEPPQLDQNTTHREAPPRRPPPLSEIASRDTDEELARSLLFLSQSPVQFSHPPIFRTDSNSTAYSTPVTPIIPQHSSFSVSTTVNGTSASTPMSPPSRKNSYGHKRSSSTASHKRSNSTPIIHTHKRRKSLASTPVSVPPRIRAPGDWKEVEHVGDELKCADCEETFWNEETWYVPRSCKRCERHSKLYGLVWPKTYKVKRDDEEFYSDDREIRRYVTKSEYRRQQKREREEEEAGVSGQKKRAGSTASSASEREKSSREGSAGARRKRRKSIVE